MPQGVFNSVLDSRSYRWRWWALIGASLAVFMAALDSNVVNVALPVMARIFHVDREIRWVVLSYILPTTGLLGAFGALSDVIGRRRITLIGVTLFILGSILCGTAQTLPQMVVYRIIQGIGGSAIGSAILAIATVNFAPEERGRAMAVIGLIAPLGAVVGPSLGGLLIGALGWPAIFYINVPFGIVAFTLIFRLLPRDEARQLKTFDVWGAILFSAALVLLIMGLSPTAGRLTTLDFVLLAGCAAAVAVLVAVERRAANPLAPPSLVGRRHFTIPLSGIMTMGIVGAGLGFVMPFFLEGTLGMGPERAGLTLLFFPLAMAAASQVGGRLSDRFNPRLPAAVGAAISLVGVFLLLPLDSRWSMADLAVRFAMVGLGFGFFVSPSSVAVMSATPRDHVGVGGALANTARFMGFALGPTLATIFWNPGLTAAIGMSAMRTVVLVLAGVQALTLASVLGYRIQQDARQAKTEVESSSSAA
ncbi:MAG: MFS transporter [Spirochaetia bacterium]|jgi:EmrB/QacA subfamily drug resistance transporter